MKILCNVFWEGEERERKAAILWVQNISAACMFYPAGIINVIHN